MRMIQIELRRKRQSIFLNVPDNSEKQGSTGLGLTIARYLAEAMGASLEAELTGAAGSETGKKGSAAGVIRFTLRFSKGQISAISEKD